MTKAFYPGHTPAGAAMTKLILESFHLHGTLLATGDRLTRGIELTTARWQVLSALARADRPESAAYVARNMGRARQSVQRVADELEEEGFLTFEPNPHHLRAPVLVLTEKGQKAFRSVTKLQVPWVNALVKGIPQEKIAVALDVIHEVRVRLERDRSPKKPTRGR